MEPEYKIQFLSKSEETFENGLDQIFNMTKYRDELDKMAIDLPAKYQLRKSQMFEQSRVLTKFINEFYKSKI